jgi:hypothetical protein
MIFGAAQMPGICSEAARPATGERGWMLQIDATKITNGPMVPTKTTPGCLCSAAKCCAGTWRLPSGCSNNWDPKFKLCGHVDDAFHSWG